MGQIVFFIAAFGALAGAVGVVAIRNPFYAVLALVTHLVALAALFLLLQAEFLAAAQVVVYAGAVMVLYVFVVSYVGGDRTALAAPSGTGMKLLSGLFAGVLLIEVSIAMLGSGLTQLGTPEAAPLGFGTPYEIGRLLLTKFLIAFELASVLLLMAAVGAVVLARRRAVLETPGQISVGELLRGEINDLEPGTTPGQPLETQAENAGIRRS